MPKRASTFKLSGVLEYGEHIKAGWQKRRGTRDSVAPVIKTTRSHSDFEKSTVYLEESESSEDDFQGPRPVPAKATVVSFVHCPQQDH